MQESNCDPIRIETERGREVERIRISGSGGQMIVGDVTINVDSWSIQPEGKIERSLKRRRIKAELSKAKFGAGRNDPCPCRSGKKFKRCCMPGRPPETYPPTPVSATPIIEIKTNLPG